MFTVFFNYTYGQIINTTQHAAYYASDAYPLSKQIDVNFDQDVFITVNEAESISDSIQLFDYLLKNEANSYFTAYLVNNSNKTAEIVRQDRSFIMIQEAKDKEGIWRPIEHWYYSGCGNSYFNPLVLTPQSYSIIAIKKYSGSFITELRLKTFNKKKVMYSEVFHGSIDVNQFNKKGSKEDHEKMYLNRSIR